jgi:hypothetical protein
MLIKALFFVSHGHADGSMLRMHATLWSACMGAMQSAVQRVITMFPDLMSMAPAVRGSVPAQESFCFSCSFACTRVGAEVWWALHKCSHSTLVSLNPSVATTVLMLMDSVGARHEQVYMFTGAQAPETAPVWAARDLESESGKYDVVTCLDVMIHYPQVRFR